MKNSQNITINNNILYNAWVFGAQITTIESVAFTNNVIIGVDKKPTFVDNQELVACLYVEEYISPNSNVSIKENYCLGSTAHGFAIPFTKCD